MIVKSFDADIPLRITAVVGETTDGAVLIAYYAIVRIAAIITEVNSHLPPPIIGDGREN